MIEPNRTSKYAIMSKVCYDGEYEIGANRTSKYAIMSKVHYDRAK